MSPRNVYRAARLVVWMSVPVLLLGCARQVTGGAASQQQVIPAPAAEVPPHQPAAAVPTIPSPEASRVEPAPPAPVAPPVPSPEGPTEASRAELAPLPVPPVPEEAHKPEIIPAPPVPPPAPAPEERVVEVTPPSPLPPPPPSAEPALQPPSAMPAPSAAATTLSDVYFDYDQSALKAASRSTLEDNARALQNGLTGSLVIEGHCDERGTHAYNMVLGERRAQAVRRYLEDLGIASDRIQIVSYGKERPFCKEHSEACWQENRRAHFSPR